MLSSGYYSCAVVRRDGKVKCAGDNECGQCDLPVGQARDVCCGGHHTIIHKTDGTAVACGLNRHGQCMLPQDMVCKQVHAGAFHTGLLHTDGIQS